MTEVTTILIFLLIQMRNLSAFFSITLFSIYLYKAHPEKSYPVLYEGKMTAMDFEYVFESEIPFNYFFEFIKYHSKTNKIYLDVFVMVKLYES